MQHIDQKEVDQAYEALNKANFRVREAAEKLSSCQQELESLERNLRSMRQSADSVNAQLEYSRNNTSAEERITHLENLISGARNQSQNAEQTHQQERKVQQTAQSQVQKLLSRIEQALNSVKGNIQKLQATTGKPAQRLAGMLRIEQQEQSKLQHMRRRLADVLETSQRAEMAGPSRGSGGGGLEGIVSRTGGGTTPRPMIAPRGYLVTRVEEVYIRRTVTYSVQQQMAADPYVYPHPDNHAPEYLRVPWRANELFGSLPYYFR